MTTLTFDTHGFVKRLQQAGVPENQAEAIVTGVKDAQLNHLAEVATKNDLKIAVADLKAELTSTLTNRFYSAMLGQTAVLAILVKWLVGS